MFVYQDCLLLAADSLRRLKRVLRILSAIRLWHRSTASGWRVQNCAETGKDFLELCHILSLRLEPQTTYPAGIQQLDACGGSG